MHIINEAKASVERSCARHFIRQKVEFIQVVCLDKWKCIHFSHVIINNSFVWLLCAGASIFLLFSLSCLRGSAVIAEMAFVNKLSATV